MNDENAIFLVVLSQQDSATLLPDIHQMVVCVMTGGTRLTRAQGIPGEYVIGSVFVLESSVV